VQETARVFCVRIICERRGKDRRKALLMGV